MKPFTGGQLAFEVDRELDGGVFSGHDERGARYLIAHTASSTWLCALVSDWALECLATGQAELRDVFSHTVTGLVERITVVDSVVRDETFLLCRELTDDELPRPGLHLSCPARCV